MRARGNRTLGAFARPRAKNLLIIAGILERSTRAESGCRVTWRLRVGPSPRAHAHSGLCQGRRVSRPAPAGILPLPLRLSGRIFLLLPLFHAVEHRDDHGALPARPRLLPPGFTTMKTRSTARSGPPSTVRALRTAPARGVVAIGFGQMTTRQQASRTKFVADTSQIPTSRSRAFHISARGAREMNDLFLVPSLISSTGFRCRVRAEHADNASSSSPYHPYLLYT